MVDIKSKFNIKLLSNIVYYLVLVFLVVIAAGVAFSALDIPGGIKIFTVQSGSMEPTLKIGGIVLVKPFNEYKERDVVTYSDVDDPKVTITHRIVEIGEGGYTTKGDVNNAPDAEKISQDRVLGKVIFSLPYLGYPISFAKTQMGFVMLIVIPGTLIIYSEFLNIKKEIGRLLENRKNKKQGEEKE